LNSDLSRFISACSATYRSNAREAKIVKIYVKDTVQKLDVFNNLRSRLDLFKDLIEKRFIDKTLQIDRESGFKIISKTGLEVPLDTLSSGEQHQLILVFDLLFEVTENSLILIDEPELSLHVAWQKTFIESLKRIIALNAFDVLLVTHSPALVARHFDLAVELGPVDE
jgi:predicted ATP-binding protein involved in virulence